MKDILATHRLKTAVLNVLGFEPEYLTPKRKALDKLMVVELVMKLCVLRGTSRFIDSPDGYPALDNTIRHLHPLRSLRPYFTEINFNIIISSRTSISLGGTFR
jgi:hypothetical protein